MTIIGNVANGIQLSPNEAAIQIKDEDHKISFSMAFCIIIMVCHLCVIYVCIGVVIGFEDMLYFVDGEVIVNVAVLTGTLSSEVHRIQTLQQVSQ